MRSAARGVLVLGCTVAWAQWSHALEDDRGKALRLNAPAARIVTLAPHLAEIVFAAGAGDKLAGVADFSDFPPAAQRLPRVGDAARVDPETILLLKPDLILGWKSGNQRGDIERLDALGLRVFVTEPLRLADIGRLIRSVGKLAGTAERAEEAATAFEREMASLRERFGKRPAVRVFYEIWHRPLLTVNGRHMISDVIGLCGGVNVFADAPLLTPAVSLESVLAARPQAIIGGGSAGSAADFAARWRAYRLAGLRDVVLVHVPPDEIQRATPRTVAGARILCEGLEKARARFPDGERRGAISPLDGVATTRPERPPAD